jgi:hypothetical protein
MRNGQTSGGDKFSQQTEDDKDRRGKKDRRVRQTTGKRKENL